MIIFDVTGTIFITSGAVFFLAGSIGMLRFPDIYTRLHALTKADNLGLGLLIIGIICIHPSPVASIKLIIIWLLTLVASTTSCQLICRLAYTQGTCPIGDVK